MATARTRRQKGGSSWVGYLVLIGIGLIFSPGASMVVAIGLMPTLVALFVTTGPSASQRIFTVASFNLAGVIPFGLDVALGQAAAGEVIADIFSWAVMMGAAGCGAALNYFGPIIAAQILTGMAASEQRTLDTVREKLVDEWGEDVLKMTVSPVSPRD
ncbi:MAG: hypothetical protein AAF607_11100 [Pseudomonadota bacterium]